MFIVHRIFYDIISTDWRAPAVLLYIPQAILAEDSALEEMRFKLVPKTCTEDRFWGNYLYV